MPSLSFFRCAWLALSAFVFAGAAQAQAVADPAAELGALTQRWLDDALTRNQAPGATLRMEVSVGTLDSRLRLAPCSRVEPYLPAGSRLWGRTRLGLRCVEGSSAWNVFLPVTIKAWGPAWVLTGDVAPGAVLTANDAAQAEVDWAADAAPVSGKPRGVAGPDGHAPVDGRAGLAPVHGAKPPACSRPAPRCVCQPKARVML